MPRGAWNNCLDWAGAADVAFEPSDDAVLHPGQRATVVAGGAAAGPQLEHRLELGSGVYVFELASEAVLSYAPRNFSPVSKVPSVRRDLALLLANEIPASRVRKTLTEALGDILADLTIFDVYRGKGIDSNEKSVAVGLTFQHPSATLTEGEISGHVAEAVAALHSELGARLR